MTAQRPDSFILDNLEFSLVGINGSELFNPTQFGIHPIGLVSDCWRGYECLYTLKNNKLLLDTLYLALGKFGDREFIPEDGPIINGVKPGISSNDPHFNNIYKNLELNLNFSGGLLIGRGFITELYVHMGFHPAWKYREVFELLFEEGDLKEQRNVSKAVQEFREKMVKYPMRPGFEASAKEIKLWIETAFSLDYSF